MTIAPAIRLEIWASQTLRLCVNNTCFRILPYVYMRSILTVSVMILQVFTGA